MQPSCSTAVRIRHFFQASDLRAVGAKLYVSCASAAARGGIHVGWPHLILRSPRAVSNLVGPGPFMNIISTTVLHLLSQSPLCKASPCSLRESGNVVAMFFIAAGKRLRLYELHWELKRLMLCDRCFFFASNRASRCICSLVCLLCLLSLYQRLRTPHLRIRFAQGIIRRFLGDVNANQEEV